MIYTGLTLASILLHTIALVLSVFVVRKYEHTLIVLCPTKAFNPFSFAAVRLWTILLSIIVAIGFLLMSMQLLVAKTFVVTVQYLILDVGAAMLNVNYLILLLLEKRGL